MAGFSAAQAIIGAMITPALLILASGNQSSEGCPTPCPQIARLGNAWVKFGRYWTS
jgi:hypothetical protein